MSEKLRAFENEDGDAAIWWEDGGMQVRIDGTWHVRCGDSDYIEADEESSELYNSIIASQNDTRGIR